MHSVQLTKGLFRNFSAAFFVFFAAAAGTRIIRTDFLFGVSELFGFTPLFCYLAAAFRRKHAVPFAKIVQPIGLCFMHVEVKLFKVDIELDFRILFNFFKGQLAAKACVDAVDKADKDFGGHSEKLRKLLFAACILRFVCGKNFFVCFSLRLKIAVPKPAKLRLACVSIYKLLPL